MRVVIAITGATGAILGIRTLQRLGSMQVETHLCVSKWGQRTIELETPFSVADVRRMASEAYSVNDQAATISSGSFLHDGMIIIPCSVRTLAAIAHGLCDNLISRAADVTLKERRPLVLSVRESPLNDMHLENMLRVSRAGAIVAPPVPAFYHGPDGLEEVISHTVTRTLDLLGIHDPGAHRWEGDLRPRNRQAD
jgi:flavin prenyltransferase